MDDIKQQETLIKAAKRDLSAYINQFSQIVKEKDVSKRMVSRASMFAYSYKLVDNNTTLITHTEKVLAGLVRNITECMMILQANQLVQESEQEQKTLEANASAKEGESNG